MPFTILFLMNFTLNYYQKQLPGSVHEIKHEIFATVKLCIFAILNFSQEEFFADF